MTTRCEIVLALPKFHPLHQEEGEHNIVEELRRRIQTEMSASPLTKGWDKEYEKHEEPGSLLESLRYAVREAAKRQGGENLFVFIASPPQDLNPRKFQDAFRQWPHNARAVILLVDEPGKEIKLTFFTEAAKLARENRVIALLGKDMMDRQKLPQIMIHLAGVNE